MLEKPFFFSALFRSLSPRERRLHSRFRFRPRRRGSGVAPVVVGLSFLRRAGDGMVLVDESPGRRPVTALTSGAVLSGSRSVPDILTKHGMPPTPLLPARRAGHPPGGQRSVPSSRELSYLHDTSDTQPMSPGPAYLTPGFSSAVSQVCWLNPYPICAHIDPPPCVQCNRQLN